VKPWLASLVARWDVDAETRTGMPFDRMMALVNLRRAEVACLLEIVSDTLEIASGLRLAAVFTGIPVAIGFMVFARSAQRWQSVRAQQQLIAFFLISALCLKLWGTANYVAQGRIASSFPFTMLTLTLLMAMPPRTMAAIISTMLLAYGLVVARLPIPSGQAIGSIVSTTIICIISLVANWLIFRARRDDHELRLTIRRQNNQLMARNDELNQLMAITAHDLRSPLYGLRNLFDLAERRAEQQPTLPLKALHDGMFSIDAMISLVTRLLHAHSAEHGPLPAVVRHDVRSHLIAAARRAGPQAEAATAEIKLNLPQRPVCALFDAGALAQILDNLIGNALRFTPPGVPVILECGNNSHAAVIRVSDRGPGIAPALRPNLFKKFSRGDAPPGGERAGTGMGLFIADQLAERLGGTLSYQEREHGGSTFQLVLPDEPDLQSGPKI
jgi:signal transduction histidine kinase